MSGWSAVEVVVGLLAAAVVAAAMELWARFLHGRVWHHRLWGVHRSHHEPRAGRFEKNDALSLLHAPIAAGLLVAGCQLHGWMRAILVGAGVGMTLFGIGYVLVHDGLVHGRLPVKALLALRFFRRIRGAHLVHHRTGGAPYGFFLGPRELMRHRRGRRGRDSLPSAPSSSARAPS